MERRGPPEGLDRWVIRYGGAVGVTAAAALLQKELWPYVSPSPLLLLYPAVLVVARVAGLGPALVSIALSIPVLLHWFLPPYGSFAVERPGDVLNVVVYAMLASVLAFLVERVKRSEQKARVAIEAAPIPTALLGARGDILFANKAFVDTLALAGRELGGTPVQSLAVAEDAPSIVRALELGRRRGVEANTTRFDARFVAREGRIVYTEATLSTIRARRAERYVLQLVDVTERHDAEVAREQALARLHALVEQCPAGILFIEEGGRVVLCNSVARALSGRTPANTSEGISGLRYPSGAQVPPEEAPSARALRGEHIAGLELLVHAPDGREVPILLNATALPAVAGEPRSVVAVFQDISALKELEQLRAQWNAVIAHDLRQPLHSILMRTELLSQRARAANRATDELDAIARATRHLNTMVQDILDASRLEARNLPLHRRDVDLDMLVLDRVHDVESSSPERRFVVDLHGGGLRVWADPERLVQVVDNLLSNAVKYGDVASAVRVEVGRADGSAFVAVTSEGEPIPDEEIPHLFDRFRRAESAVRRGIAGVGLGLYIVRELVAAHGGEITCASTPDGRTTFRFTVPLASGLAERRTVA